MLTTAERSLRYAIGSFMRVRLLLCLLIGVVLGGCDKKQAAPTASAPPASQPAAVAIKPATMPSPATAHIASTEPSPSVIMIDNQRTEFPPAKLNLQLRDDKVHALLLSDDPPTAISENYTGNSFYIEMTIDDVDDLNNVPGASVQYQAATSTERDDSPDGIFLEGGKKQLQPQQVKVEFESAGAKMAVRITGTFVMFDTQDENVPSRQVPVSARLFATIKK
jgi:hypothetical protein